jgi:hypothetical protein
MAVSDPDVNRHPSDDREGTEFAVEVGMFRLIRPGDTFNYNNGDTLLLSAIVMKNLCRLGPEIQD